MPKAGYPTACPFCRHDPARVGPNGTGRADIDCPNCGQHQVTTTAETVLQAQDMGDEWHARLSYAVKKLPPGTCVSSTLVEKLVEVTRLPTAHECIDNLVTHLATTLRPGETVTLYPDLLRAVVGAVTAIEVQWVINEAKRAGLLNGKPDDDSRLFPTVIAEPTSLTVGGWQHHADLMRQGAGSRHAFMAMDFNEADIRDFFAQHLQPAVAQTGFELRTTDHPGKTADLIDNRMRVELRTSRFVVCDLTHGNRGAYWEAGFAEGIGRPVFYICRHDVRSSKDKAVKPHFDTAHQPIVSWDSADPGPGLAELKAMIRATLPAEATMQDA